MLKIRHTQPMHITVCILVLLVRPFSADGDDFKELTQLSITPVASTFIGDTETPYLEMPFSDMAIDKSGNVYVTGITSSSLFPITKNAFDTEYNGGGDVFIAKFDSGLKTLMAATYFGGGGREWARSIAINQNGDVLVAGLTSSIDFPFTSGLAGKRRDMRDADMDKAFILKFDSELQTLHSAFLIGKGDVFAIGFGAKGEVYVTGATGADVTDDEIPKTPETFDLSFNGGESDIFIAKLDPNIVQLLQYTLLGGKGMDEATSIAVTNSGDVFITGQTSSIDFPVTAQAFSGKYNGGEHDAFISVFDGDLTDLKASTFWGGQNRDVAHSLLMDENNHRLILAGRTGSKDLPMTATSFDSTFNGGAFDAFISSFDLDLTILHYSTFLGGNNSDRAFSISRNIDGFYILSGDTNSIEFEGQINNTPRKGRSGGADGFIALIDSTMQVQAISFLGGLLDEFLVINKCINDSIYILGSSLSDKLSASDGLSHTKYTEGFDSFVSLFQFSGTMNTSKADNKN